MVEAVEKMAEAEVMVVVLPLTLPVSCPHLAEKLKTLQRFPAVWAISEGFASYLLWFFFL